MDLDLGGNQKRGPAKSGRRARITKSKTSLNTNDKGSPPSLPKPIATSTAENNSPARPSRRMGGWGDAAKRDAVEDSRLFSDARTKTQLESDDDGSTPDIEMIPDEDDFLGQDIKNKMAAPPSISLNQVATYRELDSDLQRHSSFTLLDNEIDLKLLAKHMASENETVEEDVPWDWDGLFTDVSSNLKSQLRQNTDTTKQANLS